MIGIEIIDTTGAPSAEITAKIRARMFGTTVIGIIVWPTGQCTAINAPINHSTN